MMIVLPRPVATAHPVPVAVAALRCLQYVQRLNCQVLCRPAIIAVAGSPPGLRAASTAEDQRELVALLTGKRRRVIEQPGDVGVQVHHAGMPVVALMSFPGGRCGRLARVGSAGCQRLTSRSFAHSRSPGRST